MAFGSELGTVCGEADCPRCNAPAVIRAKRKESSGRVVLHLTCEKCHLIRYQGNMTDKSFVMERVTRSLIKRKEKASTEEGRERIQRKIDELEKRRRFDIG